MQEPRHAHTDPTETVDLSSPYEVQTRIGLILKRVWPDYDHETLAHAIDDVARAFRGDYPGLLRCDTFYHDLRHALDAGLAMARLLDGHARATREAGGPIIDTDHALLGVLLALYHDIGLLRRDDEAHLQGASLTPVHERRGVGFMTGYLSKTPLGHLAEKAELIMVTRLDYHMPRNMPPVDDALACLLGSSDLMAQLADRNYLEKCREFLFIEFSAIGIAGSSDGPYPTPEILLKKTPAFYTGLLRQRIHDEYGDADRFMAAHFEGTDPYTALDRAQLQFPAEDFDRRGFQSVASAAFASDRRQLTDGLFVRRHQGDDVRRRERLRVKGPIAIRIGHTGGHQILEIEQVGVHQMRWRDA